MPSELYKADSIEEAKKKLRKIYQKRSLSLEEIKAKKYEKLEQSEHEDSDNHFNEERLGKETKATDIAYYKYLEKGYIAYRILYVDTEGNKEEDFFIIKPNPEYND
ncbi:hypothetical protein HOG17_05180 [Candidatus Peregrinibacteria bacterium]|jgi:hypothetical protein|nr:hypothetical protein [Candidatus Peregrinibacteria bacterium]MBT4147811.1 hypothetical protein [Candidatus Peregrinibacteria bacterium]MBT4365829.1 hypothetical protein [Candidatus Peregrinibacteria bacterium]MBT4455678.1 hypothetical protein [Candidatus Peregrinibacteria bacterium]